MNKTVLTTIEKQFGDVCKVVNLKREYPGYVGAEEWGIITPLSLKDLHEQFEAQIILLEPFVVLPIHFDQIRREFLKNEKKHEKRAERSVCIFDYTEETERHHPEILSPLSLEEEFIIREEKGGLYDAIKSLDPVQKGRIIKRFFQGKSLRKIAMEEGRSYATVYESYLLALKNLKHILENSNDG